MPEVDDAYAAALAATRAGPPNFAEATRAWNDVASSWTMQQKELEEPVTLLGEKVLNP